MQKSLELAKAYVLRCQQADGGFAFTCEPASLNNKAAYADTELTKPRSYGTATCDGVLALVACGTKTGRGAGRQSNFLAGEAAGAGIGSRL